jgi:nucleoside-diphosphate-sugar epimerase
LLAGKKILITGGTGTVGRPPAEALAKNNEVWCLGRFSDPSTRAALDARGITTYEWDMAQADPDALARLPSDFTHVVHAAVLKGIDDFDTQIEVNATAAAALMTHCQDAEAFLFVSSTAVYQPNDPEHRHKETDPLGGTSPYMKSYPTQKIGTEAVVRALARTLQIPATIARLSVTYGPAGYGGLPPRFFQLMLDAVPIPAPHGHDNWCMPMHTDDVTRQVPMLWEAASVPATVVNWGGDDVVGQREFMSYISEITDVPVTFVETDDNRASVALDNTKRQSLIGECTVNWRAGMRRTIEAHFPGAVRS